MATAKWIQCLNYIRNVREKDIRMKRISRRSFINTLGAGFGAACVLPLTACSRFAGIDPEEEGIVYVDENRLVAMLMGDPQYPMIEATPKNIQIAMDDLAIVPHDFLAVMGDLVQNKAHYYEKYKELVIDQSTKPLYSLAGNADRNAGLQAYQDTTGHPLYYAINRRGIRFIFTSVMFGTGLTKHICHMGDEQMEWLKAELASDTKSTTIILSHPPIFETTWRSEDRSKNDPPAGSMFHGESEEMRKLFAQYPNIKLFASGHLHYRYGVVDEYGRNGYFLEGNVLHISVGATSHNRGSIALFIEEDKMVAKVRNHETGTWEDKNEYTHAVKTTLRPAAN